MTENEIRRSIADSIYAKNMEKMKNYIEYLEKKNPEFKADFKTHR